MIVAWIVANNMSRRLDAFAGVEPAAVATQEFDVGD